MRQWEKAVPIFRRIVESERSRWRREMGSFLAKVSKRPLAKTRLPSAFSNSMGLIFWGMVEEPTNLFLPI